MIISGVNLAWCLSNLPSWWRYRRALAQPARAQERVLRSYVGRNADTAFGRAHGFDRIRSVADYQRRVPIARYEDYEPLIARVARGERAVLTMAPVRRLAVTGGSTAGPKLIPYTAALHAEYARGVGPWVVDLYRRRPQLLGGPAYWSITPRLSVPHVSGAAIPIGFEEDSRHLGGVAARLIGRAMAVPDCAGEIADHAVHRHLTLLLLLRASDLRLISVWHPSFLTLLLDAMRTGWDALLRDIRDGGVSIGAPLPSRVAAVVAARLRPDPARARELGRIGPDACDCIWPRLGLVSCWGDGAAGGAVEGIRRRLPGTVIQRKGLLATEAIVTLPFGADEARPLAIRSHFFEFIDAGGRVVLAHELEAGGAYEVIVTTGGGLYRYRLGDLVRVDGVVDRTPSLTFVAREASVSDRVGEKLQEQFVAAAIASVFEAEAAPAFALLSPERTPRGLSYVLFVEAEQGVPADAAARLESALRANPHYALAVDLGQLAPSSVVRIRGGFGTFASRAVGRGQRLGDVKPIALDAHGSWSGVFERAGEQAGALGAAEVPC
jgi:hypothetical protein